MKKIFLIIGLLCSLIADAQLFTVNGSNRLNTGRFRGGLRSDSSLLPPLSPYYTAPVNGMSYLSIVDTCWKTYLNGVWYKVGGGSVGAGSYTFNPGYFTVSGNNIGLDTSSKIASFQRLSRVADSLGARIDGLILSGGNSGDTSIIHTTYAALDASGTIDPNKLVWLTDSLRKGLYFYYGYSANQTPDNGAVDIVNTVGQIWHRFYEGPVNAKWFDVRQNAAAAATNVVNLRKARDYCYKTGQRLLMDGTYYLGDSIVFASTANIQSNVEINGVTKFTDVNKDGFVLTGYYKQIFKQNGLIDGSNSGGSNAATFSTYKGRGVYMKNLYNSELTVNEVTDFKVGVEMAGEQSGGLGTGSQFNRVHIGYAHHNYIQVHITVYGSATGGNFCNESSWYFGQVGQGVPNTTFGARGTYGLVVDKEAGSNAPHNAIGGHSFYNFDCEAADTAIKARDSKDLTFFNPQAEPLGSHIQFMLDTAVSTGAESYVFIGMGRWNENFTRPAWNGYKTQFLNGSVQSLQPDGTGCCVVQGTDAYRLTATGKLLITGYEPPGYTGQSVNLANDFYMITGENLQTEAGMNRFNGVIRKFPYKQTEFRVLNGTLGNTSDDTLTAPPNMGYILVSTNEAKVIKVYAGDLSGSSFESFDVDYRGSATGITFINGTSQTVLMASGLFPTIGMYKCTYAYGAYKVQPYGGGVTGGSSPFTAGSGTGSPYYVMSPINIGVNPAQSYAWTTWGPSSTGKALWEFSSSSVFSATPRTNTVDYNGTDLRLTDKTGFSAILLKSNSNVTLTNAHWGGYSIGLNYMDCGSSFSGDLVVSDGTGGATTRRPTYTLAFSQAATVPIANTSGAVKTSILSGGAKSLPFNLQAGDQVTIKGSGNVTVPATPTTIASITIDFCSYSVTFNTVGGNGSYTNSSGTIFSKPYEYEATFVPSSAGTSVAGFVKLHLYVSGQNAESAGGQGGGLIWEYTIPITGINTSAPTYNVSVTWASSAGSAHTWNSMLNTAEIFRQ